MSKAMSLFRRLPPARRTLLLLAAFSLFFLAVHVSRLGDRGLGGDAREFVATAFHLAHGHPYGHAMTPEPGPPDAYRPPGYPAFLSLFILAQPELRHDPFDWFFHAEDMDQAHVPQTFKNIKYVQALFFLAMALLAMWFAWKLSGSRIAAGLALALVSVHPFLPQHVNRYYSELFAAFLIVLFTLLFFQCLRRRSWLYPPLTGLVLGALTLTLAQWYYIGLFCLACLLLTMPFRPGERLRILGQAAIILACAAVLVAPWKLRNLEQFGRPFLSERAGVALDLRAHYVMMPPTEIGAAFLYWSRSPQLLDILEEEYRPEEWANLVREHGYYRAVLDRAAELEGEYPKAEADRIQFDEAKERILSHPWNYLRTLPALTYRGMVDGHWSLATLPLYALFIFLFLRLLWRRDWAGLALLLPFAGMVAFNSVVSHNIPRYNATGFPLLAAGSMAGGAELVRMWTRRKGSSRKG